MPHLPRGNGGLIFALRAILRLVRANTDPSIVVAIGGSESKATLNELCVRLRPMHIVAKSATGRVLPKDIVKRLESDDNLYFASVLCANVRFRAEIIVCLDVPRKASELYMIATTQYDMKWKNPIAINDRLVWLRELGLIDYQGIYNN